MTRIKEKCGICQCDLPENTHRMMCEGCEKISNIIDKCMIDVSKSYDEVSQSDTEADVFKKLASLYWKKYWALHKIVTDVQAREQNEDLQFARNFLEWAENNQSKEEMKTAISEYIKKRKEESNNE